MPLGTDQQYNVSWAEQDRIRRRQEIRARLKAEVVDKKFNPFNQMGRVPFSDPGTQRFEDFRKRGRLPGAPFAPRIFYSYCALIIIPVLGLTLLFNYETIPYNEGCASGAIPYEQRYGKS